MRESIGSRKKKKGKVRDKRGNVNGRGRRKKSKDRNQRGKVKGREKRKGGEEGQGQREGRKKLTEMKIKWSDEKMKGKYIIEMEKGR